MVSTSSTAAIAGTSTIIAAGTYQVSVTKDGHSGSATVTVNGNDAYPINVILSDYVQPSVTPVPTATPIPTALHHASATVIDAPPTVIHPVVTPDANATAQPLSFSRCSVNATASANPTATAAANALPVAGLVHGHVYTWHVRSAWHDGHCHRREKWQKAQEVIVFLYHFA